MKQIFDSALVLRLVFRFRVRETEEPNRDRVRETKTTRIGMGEGGQENGENREKSAHGDLVIRWNQRGERRHFHINIINELLKCV